MVLIWFVRWYKILHPVNSVVFNSALPCCIDCLLCAKSRLLPLHELPFTIKNYVHVCIPLRGEPESEDSFILMIQARRLVPQHPGSIHWAERGGAEQRATKWPHCKMYPFLLQVTLSWKRYQMWSGVNSGCTWQSLNIKIKSSIWVGWGGLHIILEAIVMEILIFVSTALY